MVPVLPRRWQMLLMHSKPLGHSLVHDMVPASTPMQRVVWPASLKNSGGLLLPVPPPVPVPPPAPPPLPGAAQVLVLSSHRLPGTGQSEGETHCTQAPLGKTVGSHAGVVPLQPEFTVQTTHLPRPPLEIV